MRKVLEYSAIVVGGGLLIASGVERPRVDQRQQPSNSDRQQVPAIVTDVCTTEVNHCARTPASKSKDAQTVSTLGWVFGGVGAAVVGTGIVLLLTDHSRRPRLTDPSAAKLVQKPKLDVLPAVGPHGGSVDLA